MVQFHALQVLPVPHPAFDHLLGPYRVPAGSQHQADGVFRRRDHVGFRGIHHDDPPFGGPFDIDVVHPIAGTAHHFQILGCLVEFFIDFGDAADDDGIIIPYDLQQFFPGDVEFHIHFQIRLSFQHFHTFVRNPFHHDDFFLIHDLSLLIFRRKAK